MTPDSERAIFEAIYRQYRRNSVLLGEVNKAQVDILATQQHADAFHAMIERRAFAHPSMPVVVPWSESHLSALGMHCRSYEPRDIRFPHCRVNVCIPDKGYDDIFAIPDYHRGVYFDLLTNEEREYPTSPTP